MLAFKHPAHYAAANAPYAGFESSFIASSIRGQHFDDMTPGQLNDLAFMAATAPFGGVEWGLAKGGSSRYLYHYTNEMAASNISKVGLLTEYSADGFIYLTNKVNLSPMQAQIELALAASRTLPSSILRIDASELEVSIIRRVQGNLPGMGAGGGTEFLFNVAVRSFYLIEISQPILLRDYDNGIAKNQNSSRFFERWSIF